MNEGSAEKCPKELTTIKTFGADKQTNKKEGRKEGEKGRKECQERPHRSATDKVIIGAAAGSTNKVGGHNRLHYNRSADKISERVTSLHRSRQFMAATVTTSANVGGWSPGGAGGADSVADSKSSSRRC